MLKLVIVLLVVYFGGLVISWLVAFDMDPSGHVGPWIVFGWAVIWGPVTTIAIAALYFLYKHLSRTK